MSKDEFNAAMPAEFWREVVDRVAAEAPNTLLLAEAFWLLEGYFVRTLGMHRVYNSAFMVMLRDEDNAKYRQVMKNTLEFDPEVLRRFVNFMNNPDERTAVDQFGSSDKYFGVCALMVTMPGLPMLGHGQIEGFAEKYGMEFRRPLWDETPDRALIERHEREIFPLMRMRPLFAGVEQFLLYDFFSTDGAVNEDVFAYSNRLDDERGLVVYNNRFAEARGWIKSSAAFAQKTGQGDEKALVQRTLAEGLGLERGDDWYSIARDQVSGLEYIRSNRQLRDEGLYVELGAYRRVILTGFRQVQDNAFGQYGQLMAYLEGRGVPSVEEALREIRLQPIQRPYRELIGPDVLRQVLDVSAAGPGPGVTLDVELLNDIETRLRDFLEQARQFDGDAADVDSAVRSGTAHLGALLAVLAQAGADNGSEPLAGESHSGSTLASDVAETREASPARRPTNGTSGHQTPEPSVTREERDRGTTPSRSSDLLRDRPVARAALLVWALTRPLGVLVDPEDPAEQGRALFDEWLLGPAVERSLSGLGLDDGAAMVGAALARVLLAHERGLARVGGRGPRRILESLLADGDVRDFLGVNRYRDVLWFNQERFDDFVAGLQATAVTLLTAGSPDATSAADTQAMPVTDDDTLPDARSDLAATDAVVQSFRNAEEASNYQLERLLRLLPISPVG